MRFLLRNKKRIILLGVLILPILLVLLSNYLVEKNSENKTFFNVSEIKKNKVGLVLGTAKMSVNGKVNLYFKYRIQAAVELFKEGKIDYVLVSGDNANKNYNEPIEFKKELIKNGIPANKIFLDYAGFRTLDSVVRSKEVFGQESITIISQQFHNERAIYLAERNGIEAVGFNAKDVSENYDKKMKVREYLARTKVFIDILLGVQPKFLGKKIEIK